MMADSGFLRDGPVAPASSARRVTPEGWKMNAPRLLRSVAVFAVLSLAIVACTSGGASSPTAAGTAAGTTVEVTLAEFSIGTVPATAAAGPITFAVTNQGPDDVHEFVVIKTDLSIIALPTDATGAVDEAGGGMEVIGEIEDIPVGESPDLTLTLEPGAYALICNIYDETEQEAHYQEGMRAPFTVTE
jgi:uncharacterized cupredoxin-like copper-binding protein